MTFTHDGFCGISGHYIIEWSVLSISRRFISDVKDVKFLSLTIMLSYYIILHSGNILWKFWEDAYEFNINRPWRLHPKLTKGHVDVSQLDKMRNHLAEEVLNRDMLHLMKVCL